MSTNAQNADHSIKKTLAFCGLRDAADGIGGHAALLGELKTWIVLETSQHREDESIRSEFNRRRQEAKESAADVEQTITSVEALVYGLDASLIESGYEVPALKHLHRAKCCCMERDYMLHSFLSDDIQERIELLCETSDSLDRLAKELGLIPVRRDVTKAGLITESGMEEAKINRGPASDPVNAGQATPTRKLAALPQYAMKAWELKNVSGVKTQKKIAELLAEKFGYTGGQGGVSRMLVMAQQHIDATRNENLIALSRKAEPERSIDPHLIELGQRQDGRAPHRREQAKQNSRESD